jgi:NAD(P)-dependent dehydrogenase (short-subunit alcohol dehydrogenase family)
LTDDARVAVVTGGAGEIGTAIVRALQSSGHHTVTTDRDSAISADIGSESS